MCTPVHDYNRVMVSEHGALKGRVAMKAEIFARGPISCGIDATNALDAFRGACALRGRACHWCRGGGCCGSVQGAAQVLRLRAAQ